jgi:uncharacterized membrane protein
VIFPVINAKENAMLPGIRAALNYHPMLVHFPIVLWLAALLFELLAVWRASDEMQRTASRLLYLGTFAAVITALSGMAARDSVPPGDARETAVVHETLMLVATSLAGALCVVTFLARKNLTRRLRKTLLVGLLVLAVLLTIGADRGAQLVYGYGTAVNWTTAEQQR